MIAGFPLPPQAATAALANGAVSRKEGPAHRSGPAGEEGAFAAALQALEAPGAAQQPHWGDDLRAPASLPEDQSATVSETFLGSPEEPGRIAAEPRTDDYDLGQQAKNAPVQAAASGTGLPPAPAGHGEKLPPGPDQIAARVSHATPEPDLDASKAGVASPNDAEVSVNTHEQRGNEDAQQRATTPSRREESGLPVRDAGPEDPETLAAGPERPRDPPAIPALERVSDTISAPGAIALVLPAPDSIKPAPSFMTLPVDDSSTKPTPLQVAALGAQRASIMSAGASVLIEHEAVPPALKRVAPGAAPGPTVALSPALQTALRMQDAVAPDRSPPHQPSGRVSQFGLSMPAGAEASMPLLEAPDLGEPAPRIATAAGQGPTDPLSSSVPPSAPLPGAAAPATFPVLTPPLPIPPASAPPGSVLTPADPALAAQIESAIDQIEVLRETGRTARSEMTVRHAEFGPVSLRIEAIAGDLRATLASRDPGFVPAIQAALIERAAEAGGAGANSQSFNGQAGQHSGSQRHSEGQPAWNGQQGSGDAYGSSPGSRQSAAQPYLQQEGEDKTGAASHMTQESVGSIPGGSRETGLYA